MITLTDASNALITVDLPSDLRWDNEYDTSFVRRKKTRTIGGAMIINTGLMAYGQPINLIGDQSSSWIKRIDLDKLRLMYDNPAGEYDLLYNGVTTRVVFDYSTTDGSPVDSRPVIDCDNPPPEAYYYFKLKLLTTEP